MSSPLLDLAPITQYLRAKASSQLLVCAIHHFNVFEILSFAPVSLKDLMQKTGLKDRPAMVLFPSLCAMGLLQWNDKNELEITELGRYLTTENIFNLIGYAGLEKEDAGVLHMKNWLLHDGPEDAFQGLSYIKDDAAASPMDEAETARFFTLALAGRARYLSPIVAQKIGSSNGHLLDVAAGTGYYTYEWLKVNNGATATIFDRPEVLKVAQELLQEFCNRYSLDITYFKSRITFLPGDMLKDELPQSDIILAASLFHDWPEDTCQMLAQKFAAALKPGGAIWIHDAFLNDTLDGPIAVTDYSAMLFLGTKGRAYSRKEYRNWLSNAGLQNVETSIPTLMDYGLISANKGF